MSTRHKKLFSVVCCALLVVVAGSVLVGCGPDRTRDYGQATLKAVDIDDGATPKVPQQTRCPACGDPIKKDIHTDAKEGRVYFDSGECKRDWEVKKESLMANLEAQEDGEWNPKEDGFPSRQSSGE